MSNSIIGDEVRKVSKRKSRIPQKRHNHSCALGKDESKDLESALTLNNEINYSSSGAHTWVRNKTGDIETFESKVDYSNVTDRESSTNSKCDLIGNGQSDLIGDGKSYINGDIQSGLFGDGKSELSGDRENALISEDCSNTNGTKCLGHLVSNSEIEVGDACMAGSDILTCYFCVQIFPSKNSLFQHMKQHPDLSSPCILKCPHCPRMFEKKGLLNGHLVSHSMDYKFPCTQCEARFKRFGDLNQHLLTHTGNKYFDSPSGDLQRFILFH